MKDVSLLLAQLNPYPDRIKVTVDPGKKEKLETELFKLFDEICEAYQEGTLEQRIDIDIAFEGKYALLPVFTRYIKRAAERAKSVARKGNHKAAVKVLEQGIMADAIIAGRGVQTDLHLAQDELLGAVEVVGYDVMKALKKLEIPAAAYAKRANQFHKASKRGNAIKALGRALQLNPRLELNEQVVELAIDLTGQSAYNAMMTISDTYLQEKFLKDLDFKAKTIEMAALRDQQAQKSKSEQIIAVIAGLVMLGLGVIIMNFVATMLTDRIVSRFQGFNEIWLMILAGFALVLLLIGIYALFTGRLNLFFRGQLGIFSLRASLRGAAAVVTGIGYIVAGLIWMLMFALEMQFIRSLGPFSGPLGPETDLHGVFLGVGIWLAAVIVGLLVNAIWGHAEV
jgi:hypothetical protein